MKIGILTGGGDCPGLNPAIRGVVYNFLTTGDEVIGFTQGWLGLVEGRTTPLTREKVDEIIAEGGTILHSSRTNPFKSGGEEQLNAVLANIKKFELDALIAIGGDDTLGVAAKLYSQYGVKTVGVPKTMDNDLDLTDYTFGFDSASNVATDAIDRLRDTAKAMERVIVVEVMGRHAGWVALYSAVAGGADYVLIPEVKVDFDAMLAKLKGLYEIGRNWGIVVVSEGVEIPGIGNAEVTYDNFGHKNLSEVAVGPDIAAEITKRSGIPTRSAILGHIVRGGRPTLFDRVLGSRVGLKAAELVRAGDFGKMVAIQGTEVVAVPIVDAVGRNRTVPIELYNELLPLFK
jgi:6-phosphofructokinase 1